MEIEPAQGRDGQNPPLQNARPPRQDPESGSCRNEIIEELGPTKVLGAEERDPASSPTHRPLDLRIQAAAIRRIEHDGIHRVASVEQVLHGSEADVVGREDDHGCWAASARSGYEVSREATHTGSLGQVIENAGSLQRTPLAAAGW